MLDSILHPSSIAVIGVSLEPEKVGHQVFANLLSFSGDLYPVNPKHKKIAGKTCYPDLLSIPKAVDLVIIATPGSTVEDIVHQCVDKKVRGVIIITAGFAENGKKGKQTQERISKLLALHNIALLGPNTLGAINPHDGINASFAPAKIDKGSIALISQSGAMLTTVFSQFANRGVGCSFALSLGNSAGIGVNEALAYARDDVHTKVIALYVESIQDTPHFFYLAKEISKTKPIIFLKGGMTAQGQQASLSHTAALATDSTLLEHAQHQFGFTMVRTIEQFFESSFFLDRLLQQNGSGYSALPASLMILTNAGGPGVNSIDIASQSNIRLASWSPGSVSRFAVNLPRIRPGNPTDLLGDAQVSDIEHALVFAEDEPLIDSLLLILTPQAVTDVHGITEMLVTAQKKKTLKKPLIVAFMVGEAYRRELLKLRKAGICVVEYANEAVEIYMCCMHARSAMLVDRTPGLMQRFRDYLEATDQSETAKIRREFPIQSKRLEEVFLLLESYGCTLPRSAIIDTEKKLDELEKLDPTAVFPLIAKTANLGLKHKAVLGGVIHNITDSAQAREAYQKLTRFGSKVLFQEIVTDASELILGLRRDSSYGLFLAIGSGGSLSNIIADRSYVFLPASPKEIRACFKRTKIFAQLTAIQRSHVLEAMNHCMDLMIEHPEISELEINPLMVTDEYAYIADVKIELAEAKG